MMRAWGTREMGTPIKARQHNLLEETRRLSAAFHDLYCHWRGVASLYARGDMPRGEYYTRLEAIIELESLLIGQNFAIIREYRESGEISASSLSRLDRSETISD